MGALLLSRREQHVKKRITQYIDRSDKPPHPSTFDKLVKPYAYFDPHNFFCGALVIHPTFAREFRSLGLNHLTK